MNIYKPLVEERLGIGRLRCHRLVKFAYALP